MRKGARTAGYPRLAAGRANCCKLLPWTAVVREKTVPSVATSMSKVAFLIWSVVLSFPLQYLFLLVPQLYEFFTVGVSPSTAGGEFGCWNYHDPGLSPCSLGAMLANPVLGILLLNSLSSGLFSLFLIGVSAVILWLGRAISRRISATSG